MKKESILETLRATLGGIARHTRVAVKTQRSAKQPFVVVLSEEQV